MASSVYYKFKAQKDESKISFDGTGISVFDLKKGIILANNLKDNRDVDLLLYDSSSNQEYKDDSHIIPRSSSVIARRVPASRPGKGKIPMYVAGGASTTAPASSSGHGGSMPMPGRGAMSMRFDNKREEIASKPQESSKPTTAPSITAGADEEDAMAAMFRASNENWQETQEKMAQSVPVYSNRGGRGGKTFSSRTPYQQPERPLPPSYVCYRCGKKGHWIQDCPTNSDRDYDNRPRIKRTTGIPRSFLKAVETPAEGGPSQGIMITPEGGFVVAQPDAAAWQKQRSKGISAVDVRERPPNDPALACPIDKKLFKDAVKTPCCGTSYCEECINAHLLDNDFICPNCSKKIPSLDKLVMDKPMRTRVGDYIDKIIKEINEAEEEVAKEGEAGKEDEENRDDGEFTFDQQPGNENPTFDISVLLNETIPQLQAQVQQLSVMLANPNLPHHARRTTEGHYQELQMQLNQAQAFAALASDMTAAVQQNIMQFNEDVHTQQQQQQRMQMQMQNVNPSIGQGQWMGGGNVGVGNPFTQQPAGPDSAYQRLPVNGRRSVKRERPSDFLEIGGGDAPTKMPRFWE
ncbi:DWNN-domain-containing protein [Schizopora paradoxa]|uniref:DWNN-domain-containing protein n=1 Tax=Schizopora paradoxa TaxID=27342 RepID=A0A0H2SBL5_9AGAM|nr:DWNN-domain-containing protein [Schizopora paradoxa]